MGMSGQLWVDSGNQKHSDLDQPADKRAGRKEDA